MLNHHRQPYSVWFKKVSWASKVIDYIVTNKKNNKTKNNCTEDVTLCARVAANTRQLDPSLTTGILWVRGYSRATKRRTFRDQNTSWSLFSLIQPDPSGCQGQFFSCFQQQNHWYWSYVCLLPNLQYGILKQLKHWFNLNNFSFKVFYPLRVPFSPHPSTQLQLCPSTIQMCPLRISGQLTHTCSFHKLHKLFSVSLFFFFFLTAEKFRGKVATVSKNKHISRKS